MLRTQIKQMAVEEMEVLEESSEEGSISFNDIKEPYNKMDPKQIHDVVEALTSTLLFEGMEVGVLEQAAARMRHTAFRQGEAIIEQGQEVNDDDCLFLLWRGNVNVMISGQDTVEFTKAPIWVFGDVALLFKSARSATVIAASSTVDTWAMSRPLLKSIVRHSPGARKLKFLRNMPLLKGLADNELIDVAHKITEDHFTDGHRLIKQGEQGDRLYFIRYGRVKVMRPGPGGEDKQVALLQRGQVVGQRTIVTGKVRSADCVADGSLTTLSIDAQHFKNIDNPVLQYMIDTDAIAAVSQCSDKLGILQKDQLEAMMEQFQRITLPQGSVVIEKESRSDTIFILRQGQVTTSPKTLLPDAAGYTYFGDLHSSVQPFSIIVSSVEAVFLRCTRQSWLKVMQDDIPSTGRNSALLQNFASIQTLGTGSCGKVKLVRCKKTSTLYALKIINKQKLMHKDIQQVFNERYIMQQLDCPFCVKLHRSFGDDVNIYLLLDYISGGELFDKIPKTGLKEHVAKFYVSNVLIALEYMHAKGIIYRDLKPENLLLDSQGYVKVTDYGFAKHIGQSKTYTICGTPEYQAPEVIMHQGTTMTADYWSLGVLIYELLVGHAPFQGSDPWSIFRQALSGRYTIPPHISINATDLIQNLLQSTPEARLGASDIQDIKQHAWFTDLDWQSIEQRSIKAPS